MNVDHSARAHAKLSPSAAYRWTKCAGSIRLSAGIPDTTSVFAEEGTAAHELCEMCLRDRTDADGYIGEEINGFAVTDEMAEAVQTYLDVVRPLMEFEHEIEAKLDLRNIPGMEFGTGDFVAYDEKTRTIYVVDFKYGRGVPVEVADNPQLMTYALGVVSRYHNRGVNAVELIVVQPRCPHPDGPVRTHRIEALDLLEWKVDLADAAKRTMDPDAPLVPGDHCHFCKAAAICPANREKALEIVQAEFGADGIELPYVQGLSPETLASILAEVDQVESWCRRVKEFAHAEAAHGRTPPGWKLVAKRATRKWKDEQAAVNGLWDFGYDGGNLFTEPKLKSPAQVEKLLPKDMRKLLDDLVSKESSGTVLAPEGDPRPAVLVDMQKEFGP